MKPFLILVGLALLCLPTRMFWQFAAWEERLRTALDNERAGQQKGGPR